MKKYSIALLGFVYLSSLSAYEVVKGEYIVKFKSGAKSSSRSFVANMAPNLSPISSDKKTFLLDLNADNTMRSQSVESLKSNPNVEYIEPNFIYRPMDVKKTIDKSLWPLLANSKRTDIDAQKAWEITQGSKEIKIAVIDSGVDYKHADLAENMWVNEAELFGLPSVDDDSNGYVDDIHGYNFVDNNGDPMDVDSHGTHCAGTIGASHNDFGATGVMANVSIVALKFLSPRGGTTVDAIRAIDYATKLKVDIMSNSWGGGGYSRALEEAIKRANRAGILFVVASGNEDVNNDKAASYPANYKVPNVISVGSYTVKDNLSLFSNYGVKSVHLVAPGTDIFSTVPENKYAVYSGTSMATPHVAGALGLLLSKEGKMAIQEVKDRLLATTIPVHTYLDRSVSGGRLNLFNLLQDIRPERQSLVNDNWVKVPLETSFVSEHPYQSNEKKIQKVVVPGAKSIRITVPFLQLEEDRDFLIVRDSTGVAVDLLTGLLMDYQSNTIDGDTLILDFRSNDKNQNWGVDVSEVEVLY